MWRSPLTSRESLGLDLVKGRHSREHPSLRVEAIPPVCVITVEESMKLQNAGSYKDYECHYCRKKRHLASVCRKKKKDSQTQSEQMHKVVADSTSEEEYTLMYNIKSKASKPLKAFSHYETEEQSWVSRKAKLFTYTEEQIPVAGAVDVWLNTMAKRSCFHS